MNSRIAWCRSSGNSLTTLTWTGRWSGIWLMRSSRQCIHLVTSTAAASKQQNQSDKAVLPGVNYIGGRSNRLSSDTEVTLNAQAEQRRPLLGVTVPHLDVAAGLPPPAVHQRWADVHLGGGVRELVQRSAPSQRNPIRDAITTSQRRSYRDQTPQRPRL